MLLLLLWRLLAQSPQPALPRPASLRQALLPALRQPEQRALAPWRLLPGWLQLPLLLVRLHLHLLLSLQRVSKQHRRWRWLQEWQLQVLAWQERLRAQHTAPFSFSVALASHYPP